MSEVDLKKYDYEAQRGGWLLGVPVAKVIEAATNQLEYHEARVAYWRKRLHKASSKERKSLKAETVAVTGGSQTIYKGDPGATQERVIADAKLAGHVQAVTEYREWVALLEATGQTTLRLNIRDAAFFKLSLHTE